MASAAFWIIIVLLLGFAIWAVARSRGRRSSR
jgi:hypothetical protein